MTRPCIQPIQDDPHRPFWSVMIPTHNPFPRYLKQTLNSLLAQDPGSKEMQIELVDDASTDFDQQDLLKGNQRIGFHRQERTVGIGANWNTCIDRARGHWIHILHQDDFVLPGFYARLREGIKKEPGIGAAFCQHYLVDGEGRRKFLFSRVRQNVPGILTDWPEHVFVRLSFQTPAIVVKRSVYEQIGGFDVSFDYALDWDMWKRIAAQYGLWYDPEPLACWRQHKRSTSKDVMRSGKNIAEIRRSIETSQAYLPPAIAEETTRRARQYYLRYAVRYARDLLFEEHDIRGSFAQLWEARNLSSTSRVMKIFAKLAIQRWSKHDTGI